jgi:5-methylcytosine-specific restriction protein A
VRGRGARPLEVEDEAPATGPAGPDICPLCDRPIPPGARASRHHLVPKLKGGAKKPTVRLHQICHSAIHARFTEAELARRLNDPASLKAEPELARFIAWVRAKPDDFHAATRLTASRKQARPRR